jgi:hypothetical protein
LLGLASGVAIYLILRRLDVTHWVAALGAAPALLDAYQINLEQQILAEALFSSLVVGGLVLIAWSQRPSMGIIGLGGLLIGAAAVTRFVGLAVAPCALIYVVIRGLGWLRVLTLLVTVTVPLLLYSTWYGSITGHYGLTDRAPFVLYGGIATFADCRGVKMPDYERQLCIRTPLDERKESYRFFIKDSPLRTLQAPPGMTKTEVVSRFNRRMIMHQPLQYAAYVMRTLAVFFRPRAPVENEPLLGTRWRFAERYRQIKATGPLGKAYGGSPPPEFGLNQTFHINRNLASKLRAYQDVVFTWGPLLAAFAVIGLVGALIGPPGRGHARAASLMFTLSGIAVLLFPSMFSTYHARYFLPAVPTLGCACALGATLLVERWRRRVGKVNVEHASPK